MLLARQKATGYIHSNESRDVTQRRKAEDHHFQLT
jgi:hypothetical protein